MPPRFLEVKMSRTRAFALIFFVLAAASLLAGLVALAERDQSKLAYSLGGVIVFGAIGVALGRRE